MSDKRFYITDTGLGLDTVSDEMYSFGDEEDFCRLFDKLNEQQDTIGEQKIAIDELITDYKKLKKENEQLQKDVENLQEVVAELGATLLLNGFEIKINDENLSELIDDE